MISYINSFLSLVDRFVKNNRQYIGYFFIFLSFLSLIYFLHPYAVKQTGSNALLILWIILWMPILSRVFAITIFQTLLPLRKELGILMGTLSVVHVLTYTITDPLAITASYFWWQDSFVSYFAFGFFALLCIVPLTLTSSDWAMKKMGKYWKLLHRSIYAIIILVVFHVVLINFSRNFEIFPVILLIAYFIFKGLEWKGVSFYKNPKKDYPIGQLWFCVPCGYIYDPLLGDLDSGILPGTEFMDIPASWRCPVCGVTKSDFIPYESGTTEAHSFSANIVAKILLNSTTLELVIETTEELASQPGQCMRFVWSDMHGEFARSYSIANQQGNQYTFLIKLTDLGRGSKLLRDIAVGTTIRTSGVFGGFVLQDTDNPKIFVATGTGLSPIYRIITALPQDVQKSLYFSVSTEAELFYAQQLQSIQGLDLYIHITRESSATYESSRVDINNINAREDTEWYLCGSPKMVEEAIEKLSQRGYTKIYREQFN